MIPRRWKIRPQNLSVDDWVKLYFSIIKRINDYYGYRAVNRIRFRNSFIQEEITDTQDEITEKKSKKENIKNKNSKNEKVDAFLSEVEESELKEAINSLGKVIIGKNNK